MSGRGLAVQGALAILGLAVAYTTSQREPERTGAAADEIIVVDATKGDLASIEYEDDNNKVDVERRDEAGEPAIWLHVQDKTAVKAPPPKPGETAPAVGKPRPARDLRGDEAADKLLAQFAPLRSPRAFGVLDAKKSKELGLDDAKKKLVVKLRGQTREFVIGQPSQPGSGAYLRDKQDGRTYLMPRALLSDLQSATSRLIDRKLHTFKIPDVNKVTIAAAGKTRDFVIGDHQNATGYKLAPAATPDKPDEMARNWHDKIWRLFPTEVLGKGELPAAGTPKVAARVDYFDGAKRVGWIEIGKLDPSASGADAAMSAPPPIPGHPGADQPELYARTEHTAGWVRLRGEATTLTEAEKVAGGGS